MSCDGGEPSQDEELENSFVVSYGLQAENKLYSS